MTAVKITKVTEMSERSKEIFRHIVDTYVETGEPVGSRVLSKKLPLNISPATIRNVMADLEESGLLYSPHTSAGRLPTDAGLRLFVDGLLELGRLSRQEQAKIDKKCASSGKNLEGVLKEATELLSGLSGCAGLVLAPKTETSLKHIEFVNLGMGKVLVVIVTADGLVENRIIEVPKGLPPSSLVEATNYLCSRLIGRTIFETKEQILAEIESHQTQLDVLTQNLVEKGLAVWGGEKENRSLIVRGQANLLEDITAIKDLERIRLLFDALETKEQFAKLLELADNAEGVQIFIGAENNLFDISGCSMVASPYRNSREQIVGAIGVIGPTRINYAKIIPLVDYTAKVIGRLIG